MSWSIHSCFHWCKNYENRSRNTRLIVEKLLASFFTGHWCSADVTCSSISFTSNLVFLTAVQDIFCALSPLVRRQNGIRCVKILLYESLSPWHTYEKLMWVNSREKLVRVSYRLAASYFLREFLASNRACSISCEFLLRVSWDLHRTSPGCGVTITVR